jgi:hypothetical protein
MVILLSYKYNISDIQTVCVITIDKSEFRLFNILIVSKFNSFDIL